MVRSTMITEFRKRVFTDESLPAGARIHDASFVQCTFIRCSNVSSWVRPPRDAEAERRHEIALEAAARGDRTLIKAWREPKLLRTAPDTVVERATFERTTVKSVKYVWQIVLRDVTVDTCKNTATLTLRDCLLDRVRMVGDFGKWWFWWLPDPEWEVYAAEFYRNVEWALDIREARFRTLDLCGVPPSKVLRDPTRHIVLRRDRLRDDRSWERFPPDLVAFLRVRVDGGTVLNLSPFPDHPTTIYTADDLPKPDEKTLKHFALMREAGFAE
jgi:hypothetical protein